MHRWGSPETSRHYRRGFALLVLVALSLEAAPALEAPQTLLVCPTGCPYVGHGRGAHRPRKRGSRR